jgi:predicted AlkP superfamily pyrophosphatase or phosphodiesterase
MAKPIVIINCVGLTPAHIGADTPHLARLANAGFSSPLTGIIPGVTTSAQTSIVTGKLPQEHGIVGNGWYFRELGEIWLWRQSQKLIQAPSMWEMLRKNNPQFSVLKHFWWYAMNTDVTATVTPRPAYHQDGAKSPDFYASPSEIKDAIRHRHGEFPLFNFWGPTASIESTRWIAESFATAYNHVQPDLALCYLPHLDYDLQRFGPTGPHLAENLRALDLEASKVIAAAQSRSATVLVVSEYGIEATNQAVFINRALRAAGLLQVSVNATGELLDPGASRAFAVCDHQIAHIYAADAHAAAEAATIVAGLDGVEQTYCGSERQKIGLDHPRSGDVVAIAASGAWFTYDYWLDDALKPDFAQCVEIHKKPGYDPRELLFDPAGGKMRAGFALLKKKLGLRYLMNAVPLDTSLVKGSHGRLAAQPADGPIFISSDPNWARDNWSMLDICPQVMRHFAN